MTAQKSSNPELPTRLRHLEVDLARNDLCVQFANTVQGPRDKRGKNARAVLGVIQRPFQGYGDFLDWLSRMGALGPDEVRELHRLADGQPSEAAAALSVSSSCGMSAAGSSKDWPNIICRPARTSISWRPMSRSSPASGSPPATTNSPGPGAAGTSTSNGHVNVLPVRWPCSFLPKLATMSDGVPTRPAASSSSTTVAANGVGGV